MNHKLLLKYLTELGSGRWTVFRQALDFLAYDEEELYPSETARRLGMLGHVEFAFYTDLRWSVSPPTLAWMPLRYESVAILCGARSQRLMENIYAQAEELEIGIRVCEQREDPEAVFVYAPSKEVGDQLANSTGLASELNPAGLIARCLPSLKDYLRLCMESPEPSGHKTETFDTGSLRWVETPRSTGEGLYKYDVYRRPEYRLKVDGRCLKTTREIGIYLLLERERRTVLRYAPEKQQLSVPVGTPLPDLPARAATLSSGLLPDFTRTGSVPTHVYHSVPASIARAILLALDQTSEVRS